MGGGDAGPLLLLARGWDTGGPRAAQSGGRTLLLGSQVGARFPFGAFRYLLSPSLLFSSFPTAPPAFVLRSGRSQAAEAGSAQPSSVLPPSLSPHPSLFLKNVGSGVQPPALAASLPARSSPFPPHRSEPPAVPADRLCLPRWGYLDAAAGCAARPGAALAGTLQPLPAGERLIVNFKLFLPVLPRLARGGGVGGWGLCVLQEPDETPAPVGACSGSGGMVVGV